MCLGVIIKIYQGIHIIFNVGKLSINFLFNLVQNQNRNSQSYVICRPSLYYKLTSVRGARNVYILPFAFDLWLGLIAALFALTAAMTISLSLEATLPIRPNQVNIHKKLLIIFFIDI